MPHDSVPKWLPALVNLLVRDRELDALAPNRYEQDPDPEKAPIPLIDRYQYRLLGKLSKLFHRYGCEAYTRWLFFGQPRPDDPNREVESAALRAVTEWLAPAPAFPPYTNSKEKQELRRLRRALSRAVEEALRQLRDGGQFVILFLGDRQYQVGDDVVALNYAEDAVLKAYLKPTKRRAMQKDQLVNATHRDDAPRILKRLKDNYPNSLGLAIELPAGKKNTGGYRVNIKASRKAAK
jgi:hypothetical protein